ncbi:phosphoribosylamine--glycine ligase [bacterium]|nr:phosphoribosylamine--glycine ligase [bacterium]
MPPRTDILVVGSGGREHALAWKLRQSPRCGRLLCAPGNAGIEGVADCVPVEAGDVAGLVALVERENLGLVVVGPEVPLASGLVDELAARGRRAFGPRRDGARLEGSKAFAKEIMREAGVPTADFAIASTAREAHDRIDRVGGPIVVKADGLAAGKGVYVCGTADEAHAAIDEVMGRRIFGEAGGRVVLEALLPGEEASFLALTDGETVVPLASSQDHKRIGDGDTGPNTGGMGAYSPAPVVTPELEREVVESVLRPVVRTLRARGIDFRGVLYAGLMIDRGRPSVLEFNVRFGDPECQPLMMRMKGDLVDVLDAVIDGRLATTPIEWDARAAACVVVAAPGYPGPIEKGAPIEGLDAAPSDGDVVVFHAGTTRDADGRVVTAGGRVLGVTALGESIPDAVARAYARAGRIRFPGMQMRSDIGHRAGAGRDTAA